MSRIRDIKKKPLEFYIGAVLVSFLILLVAISFFYTPYDINEMNLADRTQPPGIRHLAGTDTMGRDIFSRLMVGARFTIFVALSTVFLSSAAGSLLGLFSGYAGGIIDEIIMRTVDAVTSFPGILIALVIVSVMNYGEFTIILALFIIFTPSFTRIVRVGTLKYKNMDFVQNCKVYGASTARILFLHIYPNVFPLLLPSLIIGISNAILAESSMSFLGLGIQPPAPSWGWMLNEAQSSVFKAPWYAISTGSIIVAAITGFNFLGESLRKLYAEGNPS